MSVWAESNIPFIDVETSGLRPDRGDKLLQIAVLVTDKDLNVLDEVGYEAVVFYDEDHVKEIRDAADPFVQEMHDKTGLWAKLSDVNIAREWWQIDHEIVAYLKKFGDPKLMPVGGNSVRLDMNFIDEYLPLVASYLDYHMRDVSTVAGLAEGWYGQSNFEKKNDHTAMTDIRESIRELRHYRDTIFRPTIVHPDDVNATLEAVMDVVYPSWREARTDSLILQQIMDDRYKLARKVVTTVFDSIPYAEVSETELDFETWKQIGRDSGWTSESVCISHDIIPMTPEESEQDDPCVHVLRLYPDAETKREAEENL